MDTRKYFEIVAVLLTGVLKIILMDALELRVVYIFSAIGFWLFYIIWRVSQDKENLERWGIRKENFEETLRLLALFGAFAVVGFSIYGTGASTLIFNWHLFPLLLLYPLWGMVQQFLMMSMVAGNLSELGNKSLPHWAIVLLTSLLFCSVHLNNLVLAGGTFLLAILYTMLFLKWRNLWPLGLFHGWIGAFFYFFVLGIDPWVMVFG